MDWNTIWNTIISWASNTGIKIVVSIIILLVSFRIITVLVRRLEKRLLDSKRAHDKTIVKVLTYTLNLIGKSLVVMALIGYLGIDTSGLTALIASLGVGVGLAVNGALANLAGGVLIILTRPFRVDDFIETCGYMGTVEDIRITQTRLRTIDNKVVYIPNGTLSSSTIVNYSEKHLRRVDLTFSISYSDDFEKAKSLILDVANNHELILSEPDKPFVRIIEHGSSSINLVSRSWVKSSDYWTVYFDMLERVKKSFDENGIEIPFNQVDVHLKNDEKN